MRFEAILLDFYGTVVHEDDTLIAATCRDIASASTDHIDPGDVASYWGRSFHDACRQAHGAEFRTQGDIERDVVAKTIDRFAPIAALDADHYADQLFAFWRQPPIFDDAVRFLDAWPPHIAIVVASNIDRADLEAAVDHHDLRFDHIVTSEDVRSYKPRPELFAAALDAAGLADDPTNALHVGDSLGSDVAGANAFGIPVAWVNRTDRQAPADNQPTYEVTGLDEVPSLLTERA